jgi:hypothetical protein
VNAQTEYTGRGPTYARAFEILSKGCDVPPSLEVFEHELGSRRRSRPGLAPEECAVAVAQSYRRIGT